MNAPSEFVAPDITARKNTGLEHAADFTLPQPLERYSAEDHATWATLYRRQCALLPGRVCDEFLDGLAALDVDADRVPDFERLNEKLVATTGWRLVAVPGLIPDEVFFEHLANRRFPVTWWIREPHQLDYLQEPDVFHDLFGHVPLLMNPVFADYLQAYGQGGMKAKALGALPMLARLYWYTVEFGLIATPNGLRIYGAGIVSSQSESVYCLESASPNRIGFDLERIMRTRYRIDTFQKSYFVIDSFAQLFDATAPDFTPIYTALKSQETIGAGDIVPEDRVLHVGDRKGWSDSADA
ncbi:phenylalanine 4-monooxygenase [Crenobacter sp. SG2305]|uniref:phenylalanine 4-monooxygenase n=1 Tax=Crenobacter oryzisoli TaxID=3056844 RepID=UPI0025AA7DE9|nr:phenylalanine 4-monooxygenase [Crenobacter sp. SG2305]MDN0082843.1 phenylalanine 4-monooxygenase [Crenobacter sp. SG2305]